MTATLPSVSVIVPCFNEEKTIALLLEAVRSQDYPSELIEVVIADGGSTDRTRQVIADFSADHPKMDIVVVDNLKRIIPAALNTAIAHAQHEVIVRLDAHCVPEHDYIRRSVENLLNRDASNVGGIWVIKPGNSTWIAKAIAYAAGHPLGVGDAKYRYTRTAAYVDTVPFGAYRRELIDQVGWFNEELLSNEDYEWNARVRQSGGKVWLDPEIRSTYFSRANLRQLARQYWRYGYWKWQMIRRYPATLRWRQAVPPLFVLAILTMIILLPFIPAVRIILPALLGIYVLILILAAIPQAIKEKDLKQLIGVPLAIMTMHFSWGTAFLWSMVSSKIGHFRKND